MGYTTEFIGSFKLDKPLTKLQILYLKNFNAVRHMKRDLTKIKRSTILKALNMDVGVEGEFEVSDITYEFPKWSPTTHNLYKHEFRDKIQLLLKYHSVNFPTMDVNVIYKIIHYMSEDIENIDFENDKNLNKLGTTDMFASQDMDKRSIVNHNYPPMTQPGLWNHWVCNDEGTEILWDEGEKFYEYIPWINYIIKNFIIPWGYKLNGKIEYQGEEWGDNGFIIIVDNNINIEENFLELDDDSDYDNYRDY